MNYLLFYPFPHLLFHFFIDKRSICQGNDLMAIGLVERWLLFMVQDSFANLTTWFFQH